MEQYKLCLVLLALVALHKAAVEGANFQNALRLIRPPIDYSRFCSELYSGGDKIACRIAAEPSVALLVCKAAIVDGAPCATVINNELQNLARLARSGVRTVTFWPQAITGLNCGERPREVCSGMLEEWIGASTGRFQHIRDAVASGRVPTLIQTVRQYTASGGLAQTVTDLNTIYSYMTAERTKYRQICDLQGFFLRNGGFKVMDVPDILQNMGLNDRCWGGEPTTQQVLDALGAMITAFRGNGGGGGAGPSGGGGGGGGGGGRQRQLQLQPQLQRQRQSQRPPQPQPQLQRQRQSQRPPQPQPQQQRQRQSQRPPQAQPQLQRQRQSQRPPQAQPQLQRQRQSQRPPQPQPQLQRQRQSQRPPQAQTQRRRQKKRSISEAFWSLE